MRVTFTGVANECNELLDKYRNMLDEIKNNERIDEKTFDDLLLLCGKIKTISGEKKFMSSIDIKNETNELYDLYNLSSRESNNYNAWKDSENTVFDYHDSINDYVKKIVAELDRIQIKLKKFQVGLDEAKRLLNERKYTLSGGYIVESLFKEQFRSSYDEFSDDWWIGSANQKDYLFYLRDVPTDLDLELVRKLREGGYSIWRIYEIDNKWRFFSEDEQKSYSENEFVEKENLDEHNLMKPNNEEPELQKKYIKFLASNKRIIWEIGRTRKFVDLFLAKYFKRASNIDLFAKYKSTIRAIEIKWKNESWEGDFGINKEEAELYSRLEDLGIRFEYYVLYKDRTYKNGDVLQYLNERGMDAYWLTGKLSKNDYLKNKKEAPAHTSFNGDRPQVYYAIKKEKLNKRVKFSVIHYYMWRNDDI